MTATPAGTNRWIAAWITLAVVSSAANFGAWVFHVGGVVRVVSNIAWLFGLPGWVPLYALGLRGIRDAPAGIVIANTLAWAFWVVTIAIGWNVWRHLHHGADQTARISKQPDLSRRRFVVNAGAGSLGAGFVGAPVYGAAVEPTMLRTRRYNVPIADLPPAFDGLKIVQFADPHLGPRIPASFIEAAVRRSIDLGPDLVVLNGDYVADGTEEIERVAALMAPLVEHAAIGVVGVLGNHDWWANGPRIRDELRSRGVRMIDNDRVWIDPTTRSISDEPIAGGLAVCGLGDLHEDETDVVRAFDRVSRSMPRIVVTHEPDSAEHAELIGAGAPRMDLMLCGHTHGGQVRIPFVGTPLVPSDFGQKYAGGMAQGPRCPVIVSRGIGMSLLPVRVGVPPEISLITLTRG